MTDSTEEGASHVANQVHENPQALTFQLEGKVGRAVAAGSRGVLEEHAGPAARKSFALTLRG